MGVGGGAEDFVADEIEVLERGALFDAVDPGACTWPLDSVDALAGPPQIGEVAGDGDIGKAGCGTEREAGCRSPAFELVHHDGEFFGHGFLDGVEIARDFEDGGADESAREDFPEDDVGQPRVGVFIEEAGVGTCGWIAW